MVDLTTLHPFDFDRNLFNFLVCVHVCVWLLLTMFVLFLSTLLKCSLYPGLAQSLLVLCVVAQCLSLHHSLHTPLPTSVLDCMEEMSSYVQPTTVSVCISCCSYCWLLHGHTLCSLSSIILVAASWTIPPNTSIQTQWAPRWNTDIECQYRRVTESGNVGSYRKQ